jgi:uncharacterized peroxidase-related enzyme
MPLIDYPDVAELDEKTREALEGTRTERGAIPSFTHMLANNPAVFEAALGQFGEVMYGGTLDVDLKQLAFVVVSQENECAYCAATHGDELVNAFGLSETYLESIAESDYTEFGDRQRAVAEFARQGAIDPKRITRYHVEALRAVGFDDAGVLELTTVVAQAAFANTIADAMNIVPSHQNPDLEQYYPKEISLHE